MVDVVVLVVVVSALLIWPLLPVTTENIELTDVDVRTRRDSSSLGSVVGLMAEVVVVVVPTSKSC